MSSTRPVVVFCQGSFTTPGIYDDLRDAVQGRGCDIKVLPLATWWRGPEDNREPPSMYDDAAVIRTEVEQLAGQGKDVVVVSHSYAGTPVSEGTAQMGKASMISRGKKGGVVGIGYITSVVGQVGQSAGEILASKEGETAVPFETTVRSCPHYNTNDCGVY